MFILIQNVILIHLPAHLTITVIMAEFLGLQHTWLNSVLVYRKFYCKFGNFSQQLVRTDGRKLDLSQRFYTNCLNCPAIDIQQGHQYLWRKISQQSHFTNDSANQQLQVRSDLYFRIQLPDRLPSCFAQRSQPHANSLALNLLNAKVKSIEHVLLSLPYSGSCFINFYKVYSYFALQP